MWQQILVKLHIKSLSPSELVSKLFYFINLLEHRDSKKSEKFRKGRLAPLSVYLERVRPLPLFDTNPALWLAHYKATIGSTELRTEAHWADIRSHDENQTKVPPPNQRPFQITPPRLSGAPMEIFFIPNFQKYTFNVDYPARQFST